MKIFIKSFNRPYFLDRCIETIKNQVANYEEIIVLDDGTPQKYLQKIEEKYPEVSIKYSEFYEEKSEMVLSGNIDKSKLKFPGEFWHRECVQGSEYFLLLEDDMFVTSPIDLQAAARFMKEHQLSLFKYFWLSSEKMNQGNISTFEDFELVKAPKQYSSRAFQHIVDHPPLLARIINKLSKEDYYFKKYILPYYTFYFVAGGIYHLPYFDYLWKGVQNLGEKVQIKRTLEYYEAKKHPIQVGKSKKEYLKTSFLSSATNEFPNVDFSIFSLNKKINEIWHRGELNTMLNYPNDYPEEALLSLLSSDEKAEYIRWITEFKKPFLSFGCKV